MRNIVQSHNWVELYKLQPGYRDFEDQFRSLIDLCESLFDKIEWLSNTQVITVLDISESFSLVNQILDEYVKVIREHIKLTEKELEQFKGDIQKVKTPFFNDKGQMKDLSDTFQSAGMARNAGSPIGKEDHFFLKIAPFISFIESRIYRSLSEAIRISNRNSIITVFAKSTLNKIDLLPKAIQGSMFLPTPDRSNEEDHTDNKAETNWDEGFR